MMERTDLTERILLYRGQSSLREQHGRHRFDMGHVLFAMGRATTPSVSSPTGPHEAQDRVSMQDKLFPRLAESVRGRLMAAVGAPSKLSMAGRQVPSRSSTANLVHSW